MGTVSSAAGCDVEHADIIHEDGAFQKSMEDDGSNETVLAPDFYIVLPAKI